MKKYFYPFLSLVLGILVALPFPLHSATYRPPVTSIPNDSITSAKINNGTIVNADISSSANITLGKIWNGGATGVMPYVTSDGTLGVSTNPTGGYVLTFANDKPTWVATSTWPRTVSTVPAGMQPGGALTTVATNVNTTGYARAFYMPQSMSVSKISLDASAVGVAGTLKLAIYSEDGQTQIASTTTASISGAGVVTTSLTTFTLPQGVYYFVVVPVGTADVTLRGITTIETVLNNGVASEPIYTGTQVVSAGTLPATISTTGLTGTAVGTLFRLDD